MDILPVPNNLLALKTDQVLLDALVNSISRKQSAKDIFDQRVSFVFGQLGHNNVSRTRIRQVLAVQQGQPVTF